VAKSKGGWLVKIKPLPREGVIGQIEGGGRKGTQDIGNPYHGRKQEGLLRGEDALKPAYRKLDGSIRAEALLELSASQRKKLKNGTPLISEETEKARRHSNEEQLADKLQVSEKVEGRSTELREEATPPIWVREKTSGQMAPRGARTKKQSPATAISQRLATYKT